MEEHPLQRQVSGADDTGCLPSAQVGAFPGLHRLVSGGEAGGGGRRAVTVAQMQRLVAAPLSGVGIEGAPREARLLLALALSVTPDEVLMRRNQPFPEAQAVALLGLLERRLAREPLSRLAGRREFWSLDFSLGPHTLDPRPDSETLVEAVLARCPGREAPLTILDLGTGTGCLLLALLSERPQARGVGLDASPEAVAVAAENAARLGLSARARFGVGDWHHGVGQVVEGARFAVVISNPPYIAETERDDLQPEVRLHDPPLALFAGPDGLDAYRCLAPQVPALLAPGGVAAFEVGAGQAGAVTALFSEAGLVCEPAVPDLAGIPRVVVARLRH